MLRHRLHTSEHASIAGCAVKSQYDDFESNSEASRNLMIIAKISSGTWRLMGAQCGVAEFGHPFGGMVYGRMLVVREQNVRQR